MTHICVSNLTIIVSDNGLSPGRRQAIIWTNAGIWLIGPLEINFSEILIRIQTFSFKKMHLKMSSAKWRPISASMCKGNKIIKKKKPFVMSHVRTSEMVAQYWFGFYLGVVGQQAIIWNNVDRVQWRHMASLATNVLIHRGRDKWWKNCGWKFKIYCLEKGFRFEFFRNVLKRFQLTSTIFR